MAVYKLQHKNKDGVWADIQLGNGTTENESYVTKNTASAQAVAGFAWIRILIPDLGLTGRICVPINARMTTPTMCMNFIKYITSQRTPWPIWNWIPDDDNRPDIQLCALTANQQIYIYVDGQKKSMVYEEVLTGNDNFTSFLFTNHF